MATGVAVLPAQSAFLVKEQQVVLDFGGGDQVGAARVLPRESGVQARACPGSLARVESVVRRRAGRPRASAQTCAWPKPVPKCAFGRGGILSGFGAPGPGRVTQAKWSQEFPARFNDLTGARPATMMEAVRKTKKWVTANFVFAARLLSIMVGIRASAQTFEAAVVAYNRRKYSKALRGFRVHAEQGNATAQFRLGVMYSRGEGVAKDDVEAVRWYRMAAEQGEADAQLNLGVIYFRGEGVAKDDVEAARWYRMAAEQGEAGAQLNLGVMYFRGEGVAKDDAEEARWYRMAAEQGEARAQFNLGACTSEARASPRMMSRRRGGIAWPPSRAKPVRS